MTDNGEPIQALIEALVTEDIREQRNVSQRLIEAGSDAVPSLIHALKEREESLRKPAAYLLGRIKESKGVTPALSEAVLNDPVPKVRQNAAVSLGKRGDAQSVPTLARALAQEEVLWVRSSVLLALGAIGGEAAWDALNRFQPMDDSEREVHRKALDRCRKDQPSEVVWKEEGIAELGFILEAPIGLETIAQEEAQEKLGLSLELNAPGLLTCPPSIKPWEVTPALRCIYDLLIFGGGARPPESQDIISCPASITDLLRQSEHLHHWRKWLISGDRSLRYRFSVEGIPLPRVDLRRLLVRVREECAPMGLVDSPSRYDIELKLIIKSESLRLFIKPAFMKDERIAYRRKDVGASLNPVVAACLARLVRGSGEAVVFDPTCGSATLLIERALLSPESRGVGVDVSPTAVAAARENVRAAGMERRIRIEKGDSLRLDIWPECDEILANLPFGFRSRKQDKDLPSLYRAVLGHLDHRLSRSNG